MFGFSARTLCVYLTIVGLLVFYNYVIFRQFWRSFSGILSLSNIIGEQDGFMANRFHLSPSDHAFRPPETRYYEMLVQHEIRWPNGVERRVITINGELIYWFSYTSTLFTVRHCDRTFSGTIY
jgi:hypothetical protein